MTTLERPRYRVIGTRPIRPDGVEKVTGRALYGADVRLPGMVYGKVLRSPYAHARIRRIDTSAAEKLPGVLAIVTHRDLPAVADGVQSLGETAVNLRELAANLLADDKVLYHGHAVAAVAALSPHIAEEALQQVVVEYEPLPVVLDVREAMRPDAPVLDEARRTKTITGQVVGEQPSNVAMHHRFEAGDVDAALAGADVVVEREFRTSMVHQGYIEPQNATATWNQDGTVTIWTSTQGAFAVRAQVAELLRLPVSKVRVIPMEIGGGFGGKIPVYLEPLAALLSRKAGGRPVKMTMSRTEVLQATGPTSGTRIRVRAGATKEGKLVAVEAELCYEAGAFPGSSVNAGAMCMLAPYNVENFRIDTYDVVVNKPKTAAYRAPGAPAAAFAMESVVDELARKLNLDPLRFRLENSSREGTRQVTGVPFPRIGHEECLRAAMESDHYRSPIEGPYRGRGVASGFWFNGGMQSTVVVGVNPDGTVNLIEGNTDIGGTRASLAMQLAEALGIPYEDVKPAVVDTDAIGHNDVTGGSRTTFATGLAVYEAAMDVRRQMVARAARLLSLPEDELEYVDGGVQAKNDPSKHIEFKEIARQQTRTGGPITGKASLVARGAGPACSTQIADVEVDPETGKVTVLRYTVVQDAGRAIHPSYVEGQMQGGAVQGIGWALHEEYVYDEQGHLLNANFLDYRIPTALDVPPIETVIVEVPNPNHPFGVRGVGEVSIVPPLAAIANAIYDAIGVRFTELPISPRRVLEALHGLEG